MRVCLYQCRSDLLGQILSVCVLALLLPLLLLRPVLLEPGLQVVTGLAQRPPNNLMVLSLLLTIARIEATLWRTSYRNDDTPSISSMAIGWLLQLGLRWHSPYPIFSWALVLPCFPVTRTSHSWRFSNMHKDNWGKSEKHKWVELLQI